MRLLEQHELIEGVHWWELAGHHEPDALVDAWRQVHYACQAVAEAGKGWGEASDDDSHSALIWLPDTERLPDQFFAGTMVHGERDARTLLRPWDMKLFIVDGRGAPIDTADAVGRTVGELIAWVRQALETHIGEPKQHAEPAPDLPEHGLGDGAAFAEPNQLAVAEIIRFYANTDAILQRAALLLEATDEPKAWPHHFDIATLATIDTDPDGSMTRTIGIGLTPPDAGSDTGYWYVAPWSRQNGASTSDWPSLTLGAWKPREDSMPMAVLSVDEVTSTEDRAEQHRRVAAFIAEAYNACRRAHDHG